MLRNSKSKYGSVTIAIHWISALVVIGQFSFGLYMLSLDYYDPDYRVLPYYHKSVGILFAILLFLRISWTYFNPKPDPVSTVKEWEHRAARLVQKSMLCLLVVVVLFGYLISTADGRPIEVFGMFEVPATLTFSNQEDWAGELHYWFALSVIILASLHALAALKHHFFHRDATLLRMLGKS